MKIPNSLLVAFLRCCNLLFITLFNESSTTTVSPFLRDQIPNQVLSLDASKISSSSLEIPSLTSIASNSTNIIVGSKGAIYTSSFESDRLALKQIEFTGLSCNGRSDPTCYEASRIVRKGDTWYICASKESDVEIQRYALSDKDQLTELADSAKDAAFYCPIHRTKFLASDLPKTSIVMKSKNPGLSIEKLFQGDSNIKVQTADILEQVIRLVSEFQHQDETWFVYVAQDQKDGATAKLAKVCNSDDGYLTKVGYMKLTTWTSLAFLTLGCFIPGSPEFVFNEMKDAYFDSKSQKMFATFTTSKNNIPASAICQFDIAEIYKRLRGDRTEEFSPSNRSIKVPDKEILHSCQDPEFFPDDAKKYLVDKRIIKEAYRQEPIFTIMRENFKLDKIGVETMLDENEMPTSNVFHISTDFGSVLKVSYNDETKIADWLEDFRVKNPSESNRKSYYSLMTLKNNALLLASKEGNIVELPSTSCDTVKSCRGCFKLADPRCFWYSGAKTPGCRSFVNISEPEMYHSVLFTKPDSLCPKEPVVTPFVPSGSSGPSRTPCFGADCPDNIYTTAVIGDNQKSGMSQFLENKTTFALVVAAPTFIVGLTLGMMVLFLYAYCKARNTTTLADHHDQGMYDPEYSKDTNVYEDPPTPQNVMMHNKLHHTLPGMVPKTSMAPQYFSSNNHRGFDKDYDLINGLNKDHMMNGGSPMLQQSMSHPNGHVIMPMPDQSGLGLMHFNASNGYMAAPTMQQMVANGSIQSGAPYPPPVPRRPRNMSSHSTSSEGIEPTMMVDSSSLSRTPRDDNRLIYQVPRGNNRFSSHEYEFGDTNFSTIPENETSPMLSQYNETEQHNSLCRGKTLPRNGNGTGGGGGLPDQHLDDNSLHHNSLPRQQVERRSSVNNPSPKENQPNFYPNITLVLAQNGSIHRPTSMQNPPQPQYVSTPTSFQNNVNFVYQQQMSQT